VDKKELAIKQGLRARALLEDPTLIAALDAMKADGVNELLSCEHSELVERRAYVSMIGAFQRKLEIMVANGKMAETN
jgi:hypothetical protein